MGVDDENDGVDEFLMRELMRGGKERGIGVVMRERGLLGFVRGEENLKRRDGRKRGVLGFVRGEGYDL